MPILEQGMRAGAAVGLAALEVHPQSSVDRQETRKGIEVLGATAGEEAAQPGGPNDDAS
jgi:hypothetical protein